MSINTTKLNNKFIANAFKIVEIDGLKIELLQAQMLHCLSAMLAPTKKKIKEPMKNGM